MEWFFWIIFCYHFWIQRYEPGKNFLNVVVAFMDTYEAEKPIFTSHSDVPANHTHRIPVRTPII